MVITGVSKTVVPREAREKQIRSPLRKDEQLQWPCGEIPLCEPAGGLIDMFVKEYSKVKLTLQSMMDVLGPVKKSKDSLKMQYRY